jgi:ATP-binding protein involved in chromosome partitioning
MSGFVCPCCGTRYDIFGKGGGRHLAEAAGVPFLGEVPLEVAVREGGDEGTPITLSAPDSPAGGAFRQLSQRVLRELGIA